MTALPALNVVRPALLRPWREAVWGDQDYWTWLLIVLGVLLAIRLLGLVFAETDLFFDEAQYCSWSRDLAFGYFSKPAAVAYPAPTILVTAELLRQAKSVLTDNRDLSGGLLYCLQQLTAGHHGLVSRIDDTTLNQSRAGARALRYAEPGHDLRAEALLLSSSNWKAAISD